MLLPLFEYTTSKKFIILLMAFGLFPGFERFKQFWHNYSYADIYKFLLGYWVL